MTKITEEMEKDYLEHGGIHCLFCGSENIESEPLGIDGSQAWGTVKCNDCGKEWRDLYNLTGVEDND